MAQLTINYTANRDLKAYSSWCTNNVDQSASIWDSNTQEGTLVLNDGITEIGINSFTDCSGLTSITIPNSVTSIGARAFQNCTGITNITIPNSVTSIGDTAFSGCTNLTSITLPNSLTIINQTSFQRTGITNITIPNSVTRIGQNAFYNCTSLTTVYWNAENVTNYNGFANTFGSCPISTAFFGNAVQSIPSDAFSGCTSLTNVTLGNSLTSIENMAFYNCTNLTSVTCEATTPPTLGVGSFSASNDTLYVPSASVSAYQNNSSWSSAFTTIEAIPTVINYTANSDLKAFSTWCTTNVNQSASTYDSTTKKGTLVLNADVTSIGDNAFFQCQDLLTINIPEGITSINYRAFYGSANITYVELPSTLTTLQDQAFWNNNNLPIVKCNAVTPPSIGNNNFSYQNDVLYVPVGSLSAYQNSTWNSKFQNIVEWNGNAVITYHSSADLSTYSTWITNNAISTTYDSTTQIGTIEVLPYEIGQQAFYRCNTLTEVEFTNIISLNSSAFQLCPNLTSITLPNSLTNIGTYAFYGCTGLISITLPNSLTFIGQEAFRGCTSLISVTFGNNITEIKSGAFNSCTNLNTFTIPSSVTSLDRTSFNNTGWWNNQADDILYKDGWCLGYKTTKPTGDVTINADKIAENAFQSCTGITSITLPNSLTAIGIQAFYGCTGLTSIALPNSLTFIGASAFSQCTSLATIYWNAENVTTYSGYNITFGSCPVSTVVFGDSVQSIPNHAFSNCSSLTSISIPASVTSIGQAFMSCTSLATIYWNAENVTTYSGYNNTFGSSTPVSTVVFGDSVQSIPNNIFSGCSSLINVTFGNSITSISNGAFTNCSNLTNITLPSSVTSIGENAFYGCTGFTSVIIPNSVTSIRYQAFKNCTSLTSVTISNSLTIMTNAIFQDCTGLTSVIIPNSVTSIGQYVFSGCIGLTSITIPNSVTSIQIGAFSGCTSLTTIYWNAENVTSYQGYTSVFYSCPVSTVVFGDSVQSIPHNAFNGCTGISSISIPASVTNISNSAFQGCTNLLSVTCLATTPPTLNSYNFTTSNDTLYVPSAAKSTYENTSSWRNAFTTIVGIYNITTSVSGSGSVSPSSANVPEGESTTLTITPAEGYGIFSVTDNGTSVPVTRTGMTYTISNIAADHAIAVVFKPLFTITTSAGEGGSITPTMTVMQNEDATIVITPNAGYSVSHVYVDGIDQGSILNYSFQNVVANHTVAAEFVALYTVSTTTTEGGTVSPESSTVVAGSDVTLTITPDEGMLIFNVLDNDTPVPVLNPLGMTYTISNIQENHTVEAIFMIAQNYGFDLSEMIDTDFIIQTLDELEERK